MDRARKLIHAGEREIYPYDGSGVTAAILDTGIAMHPDLKDRVIGFKDLWETAVCLRMTEAMEHMLPDACAETAPALREDLQGSQRAAEYLQEKYWMKKETVRFPA